MTSSVLTTATPAQWGSVLRSLAIIAGLLITVRVCRWVRPLRVLGRWLHG